MQTLLWPTKKPFCPIGSLPAVSLTQDLSPEQPADILLLGCGDPRNILFTLFSDVVVPAGPRKLDFTCCDLEPSILARNILLFTMLDDNQPIDQIWDIFYHFKISNQAAITLTNHTQRLYEIAKDLETWQQSSYGSFLKFVDACTLNELRGYWKNYAEFPSLPADRLGRLLQEQVNVSESTLKKNGLGINPSLSAGMLWAQVAIPMNNLVKRYWQAGSILDQQGATTELNPTFVYSTSGELFDVDYGTFPQGFHLSPAAAPMCSDSPATSTSETQVPIVNVMKQQFGAWADAFRTSRSADAITLRFFSGEALALCRALDRFTSTRNPATGVFVSKWRASHINFDVQNAGASPGPTNFDIIDTSTLTDSLDILNLLAATQPLLKITSTSQSILYTESRLFSDQDVTRPVLDRLYASIPTISSLLGLAPRDYLSGFTTHSDVHEKLADEHLRQYHERIAWVKPSGGDDYAERHLVPVSFDAESLAHVIFGLYDRMFGREHTMVITNSRVSLELPFHYTRETLATLLKCVKRQVYLKNGDWDTFGDKLIELIERDRNEIIGPLYYQDICLQLHLSSIHTVASLKPDWRKSFSPDAASDIFKDWPDVPPVLCVVFTVPRKSLQVLLKNKDKTGVPTLECHLTANNFHPCAYSSVQAVWGTCINSEGSNTVTIEEDKEGSAGKSDLVLIFWASARILEFKDTTIALALKNSTHASGMFGDRLGKELAIFSTAIDNHELVRTLRYQPSISMKDSVALNAVMIASPDPKSSNVPIRIVANVGSGPNARNVVSFTAHVEIDLPAE